MAYINVKVTDAGQIVEVRESALITGPEGPQGPAGPEGPQGEPGIGAAEQIIYDSSSGDLTPTIEDPNTYPELELILTHWRGSTGDNTVNITNTIDGVAGPWTLDKGVTVRLRSSPVVGTSNYEWVIINVSTDKVIDTYIIPDNVVVVKSAADFPDPADTGDGYSAHILDDNKIYYIATQTVVLTYPIVPRNNTIKGDSWNTTLFYNGTGAAIRSTANFPVGQFFVNDIVLAGNGTNQMLDMVASQPGGGIVFRNVMIASCVPGVLSDIHHCYGVLFFLYEQTGTLELNNVYEMYFNGTSATTSTAFSGALFSIYGYTFALDMINIKISPASGDAGFYVDNAFSGRMQCSHGVLDDSKGGIAFTDTSLDQTDVKVEIRHMFKIQNSEAHGAIYFENNTTPTITDIQGDYDNITAFEDAGGGKTRILTPSTPPDGSTIWIRNHVYNGKYTTSNTVSDVSFEIDTEYVGTGTGRWETGWKKISGITETVELERFTHPESNRLYSNLLEERGVEISCVIFAENDGVSAEKTWEFCVMQCNKILLGSVVNVTLSNTLIPIPLNPHSHAGTGCYFEVFCRNLSDATTDLRVANYSLTVDAGAL